MCVHGYGSGFPLIDFAAFRVGWLHEDLGLNVVLPVLPFHGPRRTGWQSGEGFFAGDVLDTLHAEAQAIWDLRRILSWVRAQDGGPVGVYGLSLGAYNGALLAALEDDLACVVAGVPAVDLVRLGRLHSARVAQRAEEAGLDWQDVYRVYRVISPLTLPSRVAHERRFMFAGSADCIVPEDQVRDLWLHWDRPRIAWYEGSHLSFPFESAVQTFLRDAMQETFVSA
jgi:pimeloyl-ACP methyl ester carboxylesterase